MAAPGEEIEVKFYLQHPFELPGRILAAGGRLRRPRTLEINQRYDTASGSLRRSGRLLRLRRDERVHLTFKDNTRVEDGVLRRRELEVTLDDFDHGEQLLRALDYDVVFTYEKYRTVYDRDATAIMLDELPYGHFVELEGDHEALKPMADLLGLRWSSAIPHSYHTLFEHVVGVRALPVQDLTFQNFAGLDIRPADLGVVPADQ